MNKINYNINEKWNYENGFYHTSDINRIGKLLSQFDIYNKIINKPGDILEFGVYKGCSIIRLLSFRHFLENSFSRKIYGFDTFDKFPKNVKSSIDYDFINKFENEGGDPICINELNTVLKRKNFNNYTLIKGDIFNTLPLFLKKNPHLRISLLHIDVDVYEPTMFILELLWEKIIKGGILMLDDYGTVSGETNAIDDFFFNKKDYLINTTSFNQTPCYIIK